MAIGAVLCIEHCTIMHGEHIPYESVYNDVYVRSYLYDPMYKSSVRCGVGILYGYLYCTVLHYALYGTVW
jgi:hypothetical protein